MSKYHKLIKLSITIVSLATLVFNFAFPHVALANNNIGRNSVLSFNFSGAVNILPFILKENSKTSVLPIEQTIKTDNVKKVIILTEAKMVITSENIAFVSEESNDKIAEKICQEAGITDLPCWQDLKAMREKESFDGKSMVGDGGRSRGWYQIQTKLHGVSAECALDFKCSTEWTVKNLITNGYEINRVYAISRHNGSGVMAQNYAKSVVYNSAKYNE